MLVAVAFLLAACGAAQPPPSLSSPSALVSTPSATPAAETMLMTWVSQFCALDIPVTRDVQPGPLARLGGPNEADRQELLAALDSFSNALNTTKGLVAQLRPAPTVAATALLDEVTKKIDENLGRNADTISAVKRASVHNLDIQNSIFGAQQGLFIVDLTTVAKAAQDKNAELKTAFAQIPTCSLYLQR